MSRFIGPMILAIVAVALLFGSAAGVAFVAFMGGVTFVGRVMRDKG